MSSVIAGSYGTALDVPQYSMLGLAALASELEAQGVSASGLLEGTDLLLRQMNDPQTKISHRQKVAIFSNMRSLMTYPDSGLRAGCRQRISDFGIFGYALLSSETFGDAVDFGVKYIRLLGPVFDKSFWIDGDEGVFTGKDFLPLGGLLPLATEFWFASIQSLIQCVLEDHPLPSVRLLLPYSPPIYWRRYEEVFGCPVIFESEIMEWRFEASVLKRPCPNANPITSAMSAGFCRQLIAILPEECDLVESVRLACLSRNGRFPSADTIAKQMGISTRTLHRHLSQEHKTYQGVLNEVRCAIAIEFLEQREMPVDEVAAQVGFSEASNFRKAFKKWTGYTPSEYREINY